jgi:signal transduction histidine kinase
MDGREVLDVSNSIPFRYGAALLAVALALPLIKFIAPLGHGAGQVLLAAVMVGAWFGGLGPGLLAAGLGALTMEFLFHPDFSPGTRLADTLQVGVFLLVALLISSLNETRSRLERALRQADRRKDEFLALLAHELRTPLGTLLNVVRILHGGRSNPPAIARGAELMERQVRHMSRLIDDLLEVSRIRQGKLELHKELMDLTAVVRDAVEATRPGREEKGQQLEVAMPVGKILLQADPTRLEQILVNLLTNASRYSGEGGCIWLTVERDEKEVIVRVRDNGLGISADLLPYVFDLHVQAENGSHGGMGIGLSLVRDLVQMHGGSVTASSTGRGQGSEFVVRLPASLH